MLGGWLCDVCPIKVAMSCCIGSVWPGSSGWLRYLTSWRDVGWLVCCLVFLGVFLIVFAKSYMLVFYVSKQILFVVF